jgi:hypothetical protein
MWRIIFMDQWFKERKTDFRWSLLKKVMSGRNFDEVLKGTEKTKWKAFKLVPDKFLSTCKAPNCSELV